MVTLKINGRHINLPAFFPDATHGCVRGVGSMEIINEGIEGIVVNTFHFLRDDNVKTVNKLGGIHKFTHFQGMTISDSGGFQAMSLVRRNPENGGFTNNGVLFKHPESGNKIYLTPELCIETQLQLGSDIIMCLDDCTDPEENLSEQEKSVERTIKWAKRCKEYFVSATKNIKDNKRPHIFAIIQGGNSKRLRKKCAQELIKIGFDGYAFGGWPVDSNHKFLSSVVKYTAEQMPNDKPKYAMGVGKPQDIKQGIKFGYNMFDCVLPTRDARHKRLYVTSKSSYKFLYISRGKYKSDTKPISINCGCFTCKNYSRAYLYNLFKNNDPLAGNLATIHNLRFYADFMKKS